MTRLTLSIITIALSLSLVSFASAETMVGEGVKDAVSAPGKIVEGTGTATAKAGKFLQPETGNTLVDKIGGLPGKAVEGAGGLIEKTGEAVGAVSDSMTKDPVSEDAKAMMKNPIDCNSAKQDLMALELEQRKTTDRISNGVKSVLPVSAAIRLFSGTYRDGLEVSTGTYNQDLENKISQIKTTCGAS